MNGRDLLEAMSFIDEELVQLTHSSKKPVPRKIWGALAACLCLILLGGAALFHPKKDAALTEGAAMSKIEMAAGAGEISTEARGYEDAVPESEEALLAVLVRVEAITDDGFTASVIQENEVFPLGAALRIRLSEDVEVGALYPDAVYLVEVLYYDQETAVAASVIPYKEEIP